jgi:hypothetical protein
MATISKHAQRNSDPTEIIGLPTNLPADTIGLLHAQDSELALAHGEQLFIYRLTRRHDETQAHLELQTEVGAVSALTESNRGLIVVCRHDGHSTVLRRQGAVLLPVIELPGDLKTLVCAGMAGFAVLRADGDRARLVRISLRQQAVVAERPLPHADMKLAVDAAGQHVVLTDRRDDTISSLGADLRPLPAAVSYRHTEQPADYQPAKCCCAPCDCCCGLPASGEPPSGRSQPPDHPSDEHPSGEQPGDRPPSGHSAVPSDDGGTVVGNGGRVDHYPPPGSGKRPCGRNLFYRVADLQRLGSYVVASDRQGRQVSVLTADMNLITEWQFGRGGAIPLAGQGTSTLLLHMRGTGRWTWQDVQLYAAKYRGDLTVFPPITLHEKTFIGQQTYALSHGQQPSPTSVKAVLLPVIEGSQSFTSANVDGFAAFVNRVTLAQVKDYYDENSFGILKDLNISVFGASANVGPKGGPLKLPRARIADYFFPAYSPAQLLLIKKSVGPASQIVLDGRESLKVNATPLTGGVAGAELAFPFFALAFTRDDKFLPFQVKFLGTEKLTVTVTLADGTAKTLSLAFGATTIDIPDHAAIATKLGELETYLDGVMQAAETGAGITSRLFAKPKAARIQQIGADFGRLIVTVAAASTTGNKLRVTASSATVPGGDPMGLADPILGTIPVSDKPKIDRYLENSALLAQDAAKAGYNARLLEPPTSAYNAAAQELTTTIPISKRYGGPDATVTLVSAAALQTLFDTTAALPNSASTDNNAQSIRDFGDLLRDAFSAVVQRLRDANMPTDTLKSFGAVLIVPLEPTTNNPADKDSPQPGEVWNVTPLFRPFGLRGEDGMSTVIDRVDPKIQLQSNWALDFMSGGSMGAAIPDVSLMCHEMGHALGFGDLYKQTGYRDELDYMEGWSLMDDNSLLSHHCGYHKMQAGWIPDGSGTETDYGRVYPLGLPNADTTRTWELLLVPVELWRDSLVASSRTAFGVGADVPVVQLGFIDLGGDHATFGLIEARQPGAKFSHALPTHDGGVLITNAISWTLDQRFATNTFYRRALQLLNKDHVLTATGQKFDLALAPALPVKGVTVEVLDRKTVEADATVYRIKVTRQNAEFIDLYFSNPGTDYWKNPDLWVDWVGNNHPTPEDLIPHFDPGQPTDQGEAIRVHPTQPTWHYLAARVRNRGQVEALNVKVNYFYFEPPGGGDGFKPMNLKDLSHYKQVTTGTIEIVPSIDDTTTVRKFALGRWDVPPGFSGHTCLLAQIADYKIPRDSHGAARASADVWDFNNNAQKNVDKYEALNASPFEPIEFDFSVHNDGVTPELAYLEPDGLPYGMRLTVSPPEQTVPAGGTVLYHCTLELDDQIIQTGCENDQRFQIHAWRRDQDASVRWGGVEYEIAPRAKTKAKLGGSWDNDNGVTFAGTVTPNPGGGTVYLRIDFEKHQSRWIPLSLTPGSQFTWSGPAPSDSFTVDGIARFEGNRKFGSAQSNLASVGHPPIVR